MSLKTEINDSNISSNSSCLFAVPFYTAMRNGEGVVSVSETGMEVGQSLSLPWGPGKGKHILCAHKSWGSEDPQWEVDFVTSWINTKGLSLKCIYVS